MANSFIGLRVHVTLKNGLSLQGLVADVVHQNLLLKQVVFLDSGQQVQEYNVIGSSIADLEISQIQQPQPPPQRSRQELSTSTFATEPQRKASFPRPPLNLTPSSVLPVPQTHAFEDPAILSFSRTPSGVGTQLKTPYSSTSPVRQQSLPVPPISVDGVPPRPVSATLAAPFTGLSLDPGSGNPTSPLDASTSKGKKHVHRPREVAKNGPISHPSSLETAGTFIANSSYVKRTKAKPKEVTAKLENPKLTTRKQRRRMRDSQQQVQSGWATEDATDVQELGEFDFEGNLSQFDKRTVFDQLRSEDTVTVADRLVGHSRAAPNIVGMKKLHYSENVIDDQTQNGKPLQEPSSDEEEGWIIKSVSSLHNAKVNRNASRSSTRKMDRQNSAPLVDVNGLSALLAPSNRTTRSLARPNYSSSHTTHSPRLSPIDRKPAKQHRLRFLESNRICAVREPDDILAGEATAVTELHISQDLVEEHAARSIAEIALSAINPGGRRLARGNHNSSPVIVVLVGTDAWGSRALAVARILTSRGARVIVSSLALDIDEEEAGQGNPQYALQLSRFESLGDSVYSWADTAAYLKTLDAPPELIIDGVIGIHSSLTDLHDRYDAVHTALDMMAWANKSKASVLAIDIPSGIHGQTGEVEVRDGEPAEVRARIIACLGAPSIGLLRAIAMRQHEDCDWKVLVCDIGINAAWKHMFRGADVSGKPARMKSLRFGSEWAVEVRYDGGVGGELQAG